MRCVEKVKHEKKQRVMGGSEDFNISCLYKHKRINNATQNKQIFPELKLQHHAKGFLLCSYRKKKNASVTKLGLYNNATFGLSLRESQS